MKRQTNAGRIAMFKKTTLLMLALAAAALVAGTLATTSSGARHAQRTIGLARGTDTGFYDDVQRGAAAAASALGDKLVVAASDDPGTAVQSLAAKHVDAIAVDPEDRGTGSSLADAHAAGIATLSYRNNDRAADVHVTLSSPAEFAHDLADALAAQMGEKGGYAIVPCRPAEPIVQTWLKAVKAYIPATYPHMKRLAVFYGNDLGGAREVNMFARFIKKHRRVRGLIALCPTEAFVVPQAIIKTRKVGRVFASGNGGDYAYAPMDSELVNVVRAGAEELVSGDPVKLGYLTTWAADYLASRHTFADGSYDVGGPVGTVSYFSATHELRLGQLLTITKDNVDQFAGP